MSEGPAYQRVAAALRAKISSGELSDGAQLPSLAQLATDYDVTQIVAQEAIRVLRGEGLVHSRAGVGTFVRLRGRIERRSPARLARDRWSTGAIQDADTGDRDRQVQVEVGEQLAPDYAAGALGVAPDQPVLSRTRRFVVGGRPAQLATSYLPLELVTGTAITYTDPGPGGTYARLQEIGQEPVRFTERIIARRPSPDELEALELPAAEALVQQITRWAYTAQGRCVEVTRMVLTADLYELIYDFPSDPAPDSEEL